MTWSILKGKGLPNKFWAEIINTEAYFFNSFPIKAGQNRTPFEACHNHKPEVS
jgi:hypothetical protein